MLRSHLLPLFCACGRGQRGTELGGVRRRNKLGPSHRVAVWRPRGELWAVRLPRAGAGTADTEVALPFLRRDARTPAAACRQVLGDDGLGFGWASRLKGVSVMAISLKADRRLPETGGAVRTELSEVGPPGSCLDEGATGCLLRGQEEGGSRGQF